MSSIALSLLRIRKPKPPNSWLFVGGVFCVVTLLYFSSDMWKLANGRANFGDHLDAGIQGALFCYYWRLLHGRMPRDMPSPPQWVLYVTYFNAAWAAFQLVSGALF